MQKIIWDLENHVDVAGLERLHLDICGGIARSQRDLSTRVVPHHEARGEIAAALDYKNSEGARIAAVRDEWSDILGPDELAVYNSLDYNGKRKFLELYCGGYNDGEFVRIRFTKREHLGEKFSTFYSDTTEWTDNHRHFSSLLNWIDRLPFTDVGRILIFVSRHYLPGDLHYDRRDDWLDGRHHFIWLNPGGHKKFTIYDGYKEIPVTAKAAFFDTGYIHGGGATPLSAYSIRVDGQLERGFCEEVGIPWRQR